MVFFQERFIIRQEQDLSDNAFKHQFRKMN